MGCLFPLPGFLLPCLGCLVLARPQKKQGWNLHILSLNGYCVRSHMDLRASQIPSAVGMLCCCSKPSFQSQQRQEAHWAFTDHAGSRQERCWLAWNLGSEKRGLLEKGIFSMEAISHVQWNVTLRWRTVQVIACQLSLLQRRLFSHCPVVVRMPRTNYFGNPDCFRFSRTPNPKRASPVQMGEDSWQQSVRQQSSYHTHLRWGRSTCAHCLGSRISSAKQTHTVGTFLPAGPNRPERWKLHAITRILRKPKLTQVVDEERDQVRQTVGICICSYYLLLESVSQSARRTGLSDSKVTKLEYQGWHPL